MENSSNPDEILKSIRDVIERLEGDSDRFAEVLRDEGIPHLSFSQITTVESCQYRYYLQYIQMRNPQPVPDYFTKGKLFHQCIASFYKTSADPQNGARKQAFQAIANEYQGENQRQLENAFLTHLDNCWHDCEIVAVEKSFAMIIDPDMPPCVGVIDLIVRKGDTYILVDHKTGRNFYPQDELQMTIYVEYIRRMFGDVKCEFHYDQYRWVNNLNRIRKPAFQREDVHLLPDYWQKALPRIRNGYKQIESIKTTNRAARNGECFRCPYRGNC